jgi:transketolase
LRDTFVQALMGLARQDKRVMLLTGDLGFGVLTPFAETFPDRFLNVGVAEQNMAGVATGLALEGKIVFTYSIGNFPTLRCLEQIRNDVCYHNANVKIVCIGGGFCYGPLGISHHATEDLAIMRVLPQMQVMAPGDLAETRLTTQIAYETPGPCYLRLGRGGDTQYSSERLEILLGQESLFPEGEVALLSTGGILMNAVKAREMKFQGFRHLSSLILNHGPWFGVKAHNSSRLVVTQEHSIIGGLGGAVAEVLAELPGRSRRWCASGCVEGFSVRWATRSTYGRFTAYRPGHCCQRVKAWSRESRGKTYGA